MTNTTEVNTAVGEYLVMQILIQAYKAGKEGLHQSEIFKILGLDVDDEDEDPFMTLTPDVIENIDVIEAQFEAKVSSIQ
jgi:hypothetical protein